MSLYKENKIKDILKNKKFWQIIGGIVILIIIVYLFTLINFSNIFKKDNISVRFENNPLILSEKENTLVSITLRNNTEKDQENLKMSIKSVEDSFIIFCPDSDVGFENQVTISKVAKGNERTVTCNIRYDRERDFFEGTYSFDINYYIDEKIDKKRINLMVKR